MFPNPVLAQVVPFCEPEKVALSWGSWCPRQGTWLGEQNTGGVSDPVPWDGGPRANEHATQLKAEALSACLPHLQPSAAVGLSLFLPADPAFIPTWIRLYLWTLDLATLLADSAPESHWSSHSWAPNCGLLAVPLLSWLGCALHLPDTISMPSVPPRVRTLLFMDMVLRAASLPAKFWTLFSALDSETPC